MSQKQHRRENIIHVLYRFSMIIIGAALAAIAIQLFLIPNKIIDGGIIGISLIVNYLTPLSFGLLVILLNLPFIYSGYKYIGKSFVISTFLGILTLAIVETFLEHLEAFTHQPILAAVFGGLLLGVGVGMVIRHGGSLDGTEILGIILTKRLPFSIGEFVMFLNVFIFTWAGFVFGWEQAMLSVMTYYIAYKVIDTVVQGLDETKAVLIVSDHFDELSSAIIHRLGRTVTMLSGKGGYKNMEKEIIYVVVTRLEVTKLKSIIHDIDRHAFITIMNTQEAQGSKFKSAIH
ncbi:YitT family protein [Bacillus horti]|uniref:Uncharacterized membrane-anchored protein YitT (DUF2179 family) n=1 Tax=Caldalkalibacillus horti TaxID=77523 RepID=A0ABT9W512_9BACI|nr:YitT family protein [Bacillus horti]MDQ0168343.1 uncharacterized membrane-anchored protein YitT (DUF2179 family) [Bacillus horti]